MSTIRKLVRAQINTLGDDEVEVVMSTAALARDGHILLPQGCVADNYRANPIVLWSHDPDHPVGNNENLVVEPAQISARTRFAPVGISRKADEVRGLVKAGVIRAVSIGFEIIECEPLDPKKPRGGQRITQWELLEMSFVSVPADVGAVVTARANGEQSMTDETRAALLLAPAGAAPATRAHGVRGKLVLSRGLYQVAELCWLFQELGWHVDMAKYESDFEGDESKVPGMLASVLHDLGGALLASWWTSTSIPPTRCWWSRSVRTSPPPRRRRSAPGAAASPTPSSAPARPFRPTPCAACRRCRTATRPAWITPAAP
jgi:HK97 family phage prohead protease